MRTQVWTVKLLVANSTEAWWVDWNCVGDNAKVNYKTEMPFTKELYSLHMANIYDCWKFK